MHKWLAAIALVALMLPPLAEAQGRGGRGGGGGPTGPVAGHGVEVPGYYARLDDPSHVDKGLKFVPQNGGMRATTGPASGIFWHPDNTRMGKYTVTARFTASKATVQEGFGLFIGGQNLTEDNQQYTYFLIRPDGKYLIRRRMGAKTSNVTPDWTDSAAIVKPDASGQMANELSIQVGGDNVVFMANGKEVARQPAKSVDTSGVVGLRINHNLDVQIDGFGIK